MFSDVFNPELLKFVGPWDIPKAGKAGKFERLDDDDDETGAARSIEGWVIIVSGVHEEAQEDGSL